MSNSFFNSFNEEEDFKYLIPKCEEAIKNGNLKEIHFSEEEFDFLINHYMGEDNNDIVYELSELAYLKHPYSTEMIIRYIDVLIVNRLLDKALSILESKLSNEPNNSDLNFLYGRALAKTGKHDLAKKYVDKASGLDGEDSVDMYITIGQDYLEDESFENALYYLKYVIDKEPDNYEVLNDLAYCYDRADKVDNSIEVYNKLLDIDPFNDYVWYNIGTIYSKKSDFIQAMESFDFSLALNPNNSSAIYNKAIICVNQGEFSKAVDLFEEFLLIEPGNISVLVALADAYLTLGLLIPASKNYKKALEFDRNNVEANCGISYVLMYEKDYFGALVHLRRVIGKDELEYHFLIDQLEQSFNETGITEYLVYNLVALYKSSSMDKFYLNLDILLSKDEIWLVKLFEFLPKAKKDKTVELSIRKFKEGLSN